MTPSQSPPSRAPQRSCALCGYEGVRALDEGREGDASLLHISCNRCADYTVHEATVTRLAMIRKREGGLDQEFPELVGRLHLVSGHTRELRLLGGGPAHLTVEGARAVVRASPDHVVDRLDRLLLNLARMSPRIGRELEIRAAWDQPLGYCRDLEDLVALVIHLAEAGLIRCDRRAFAVAKEGRVSLTPPGWERARELRRRPPTGARRTAFVATASSPRGKEAFGRGIRPAVEAAGYVALEPGAGEDSRRFDLSSTARVRECRFLVADGTGHDPWVHAAAGFARGVGVPVLWSCSGPDAPGLPVAVPTGDLIVWDDPEALRAELEVRILALIGRGPVEGGASGDE